MSISKVKTIAELRAQELAKLAAEQAKTAFVTRTLDLLPAKTPPLLAINPFGYCANASLIFEGDKQTVAELLELFPPLDCVDVRGSAQSQKPVKYLRDSEDGSSNIRPIGPFTIQTNASRRPHAFRKEPSQGDSSQQYTVRWWTALHDLDISVQVQTTDETVEELVSVAFFTERFDYSTGQCTFFPRRLASLDVPLAALEQWAVRWSDFAVGLELSQWQRTQWKNYRTLVLSSKSPVPSLGDFLDSKVVHAFDPRSQLISKMTDYASLEIAKLPEIQAIQIRQWQELEAWFKEFFSTHGALGSRGGLEDLNERILHLARRDLGFDFRVQRLNGSPVKTDLTVFFRECGEFRDFTFAVDFKLPRILTQQLPVTYMG